MDNGALSRGEKNGRSVKLTTYLHLAYFHIIPICFRGMGFRHQAQYRNAVHIKYIADTVQHN